MANGYLVAVGFGCVGVERVDDGAGVMKAGRFVCV